MKKINLCLLLFVFVLSVSSTTSFAQRKDRKKKGLDGMAKKAEAGAQVMPNIHMQLGCESCHLGRPQAGDKDAKLLMPNNDVVELCKGCHEGAEHHSVNVIPSADVKVPAFLPLGKTGVAEGKVVCSTCHFVHVELASNVLLRGFSDEEGRKTMFNKRLDMCSACHGESFTKKSPHVNDEKLCGFCHSSDPKKAKDVVKETIKRDIIELCDFCHGSADGGHFVKVNPFDDKDIRKDFPQTLPIVDGALTCVTCHNPHGNTGTLYLLRQDYITFAVKSKQINPHEKGIFCNSCHDKVPESGSRGANAAVKFGGSDIEMCNWCHKVSPEAGDHHPLNVGESPDSKITKMSKDLPLVDGKVTCLSCHVRKFECQPGKPKEKIAAKNPGYLIGGPYEKKNEICYKCHIKAELEKTNPHKMLDKGSPVASKCKFCHSVPPEKLVEGGKSAGLSGDINFLCILCHADRDHPGTKMDGTSPKHLIKLANERQVVTDGKIKVVKIKSLKEIADINTSLLPLDNKGFITCTTCHQVHEKGLLKTEKNLNSEGVMLRMAQDQLCNTCHSF